MSVAELKELVHQRVDEVDDELLLEEIARLLSRDNGVVSEPGVLYFTEEGGKEIDEADAEIDRGDFYSHEEAMEMLRNRSYRKL